MMKTIEAIFEHGYLKLLQRLPLTERQHVWVAILTDDPSVDHLAKIASRDPAFHFLANPLEDLYSLNDGKAV